MPGYKQYAAEGQNKDKDLKYKIPVVPLDNIIEALISKKVQGGTQAPQGLVDWRVLGVAGGIGLELVIPIIVDPWQLGALPCL